MNQAMTTSWVPNDNGISERRTALLVPRAEESCC
jgi:hypothetical protein